MRKLWYRNSIEIKRKRFIDPITAAVIGAAVLGGGAVGLTKMATGKKKQYQSPELQKYVTPQSTESGGYSLPILKARAAGQGVAFSPEQLTEYQTPYATAARGQYERYGKPAIEEAASSKGMGRSTMALQSEAVAEKDLADLIGVNWSELNKWNEELKQQGITNGLSSLYSYMTQELGQSNLNTSAENARRTGEAETNYGVNEYNRQLPYEALSTGVTTGSNIYSGITGAQESNAILKALTDKAGAPSSAYGDIGFNPSISQVGGNDILSLLKKRQGFKIPTQYS